MGPSVRVSVLVHAILYGTIMYVACRLSNINTHNHIPYVVLVPWMVKFVEFEATSVHGSSGDVANTNDELIEHGSTGMGTGQL